MYFHVIVPCIIFSTLTVGSTGYKYPGLIIPSQFSSPIAEKLTSIVAKCERDELEFPIEQVRANITSCLELFNELGEEEQEYPEIQYPESWEDEEQVGVFRASRKLENKKHAKQWCNQLALTLQCFEPLKPILEECQSPEGITLFGYAEELCENDADAYIDFVDSLSEDTCGSSEEFLRTFQSCEENEGYNKYFGRKFDPATPIYKFCEIGSSLNKCFQEGLAAASPVGCSRTSEIYQSFTDGVKSRTSHPEALSLCIQSM